ncbi:hypothetical protein [Hymenobacter sediminis]|uniref:hypothetical protein n=1 Tax=Hymenobacter sediminis TaxID=2218621 RepID=UPI0013906161|nr:hypothetical protein [Hymenobacter sediminis]
MKSKQHAKTLLSTLNTSVESLSKEEKTKVLGKLHKRLGKQLTKEATPAPIGFKLKGK